LTIVFVSENTLVTNYLEGFVTRDALISTSQKDELQWSIQQMGSRSWAAGISPAESYSLAVSSSHSWWNPPSSFLSKSAN